MKEFENVHVLFFILLYSGEDLFLQISKMSDSLLKRKFIVSLKKLILIMKEEKNYRLGQNESDLYRANLLAYIYELTK